MPELGGIKTGVGLGSGIPIQELVEQSVANVFDKKKEKINARENEVESKISTLGTLRSKLSELKDAVKEISCSNKLLGKIPSVQNNPGLVDPTQTYVVANAGSSAQIGSLDVIVNKLAVADSYVSNAIATDTKIMGTGTLNFTLGDPSGAQKQFSITVDDQNSNNTLGGICRLINQQTASFGISASILKGDNGYFLSIGSNLSGLPSTLTITATNNPDDPVNGTGLQQLCTDPANPATIMSRYSTAANGQIQVNGATLTTTQNLGIDLGCDITLDVYQPTVSKANPLVNLAVSVVVKSDSSQTIDKLEKFVEKYNATLDYIKRLTTTKENYNLNAYKAENEDDDKSIESKNDKNTDKRSKRKNDKTINPETGHGIFLGDSTIRNLRRELADALATQVNQANYYSISLIGINTDRKTGRLQINKDDLSKAISTDAQSVVNLFTQKTTTNGVAAAFDDITDKYVKTNGILMTTTTDLTVRRQNIAKSMLELDLQAKRMEYDLTMKYARLDKVLAQQKQAGDSMMQALMSMQPK